MEARAIIRADGYIDVSGVTNSIPWWSFTKTALSVALLRLSQVGAIELDNPVAGQGFTPAQLLRHEAGLPDYGSLAAYHSDVEAGRSPWRIDDLLEATEANRLRYAPGKGWAYSNIGYWHVARLIEQAADQPLADALTDLVFAPAELCTARLALTRNDLMNLCMGDASNYDPGWVYHGLIVGTAIDAAQLLHRLLGGSLLEKRTLSRMLECRPLPHLRTERYPDPGYGMGLMLHATLPQHHPVGHTGGGPGSDVAVYGKQGTTCVVWAASSAGIDPVATVFGTLKYFDC